MNGKSRFLFGRGGLEKAKERKGIKKKGKGTWLLLFRDTNDACLCYSIVTVDCDWLVGPGN